MKTVKQQAEVLFKALDFADKVVILPIMYMLAESIKNKEVIEITVTTDNTFFIEPEQANKAFKVLSDLGCRTSLGESYEDVIEFCNSQKKTIYYANSNNWNSIKNKYTTYYSIWCNCRYI